MNQITTDAAKGKAHASAAPSPLTCRKSEMGVSIMGAVKLATRIEATQPASPSNSRVIPRKVDRIADNNNTRKMP